MRDFKTTEEIEVPKRLIDQIIGQEKAVKIVEKAARQRRNALLLGSPGTGKSMLAQAMAELMPAEELQDVLVYPNQHDENKPIVRVVKTYPPKEDIRKSPELMALYVPNPAQFVQKKPEEEQPSSGFRTDIPPSEYGLGRRIIARGRWSERLQPRGTTISPMLLLLFGLIALVILFYATDSFTSENKWYVLAAVLGFGVIMLLWNFTSTIGKRMGGVQEFAAAKLIVDNSGKHNAPFVDATGAKAGALLGDVKHDPLQCIPGDEIIHLKNGKPVRISELVDPLLGEGERELKPEEKFEVLGGYDTRYCYTSSVVHKVFKRKYDGEICEIETRRGHKISVTPNHPLAVLKGDGTIEYVEAGKIDSSAHLVLPYRLPICKAADYKPDFIRFLGYVLADGYFGPRTVGFKVKRQFKIDEIERCLRANGFDYRKRVYRGATIFNINSAALVRRLTGMGVRKGNRKSIPSIIFDLDKEGILHFLSAYMSLDGYVNKQGQFELFSKDLIPDLAPLLLKVGMRPKIKQRPDRGFGRQKNIIQQFLLFNSYELASEYYERTVNPFHKSNLTAYMGSTDRTHVAFDDEVPISFETLEEIRKRTGLSQNAVHVEYYSLKPDLKSSKSLTRQFLATVCARFSSHTNCPALFMLKNISDSSYSFDAITSIKKRKYSGHVYNLTTESGNYLVNNVLTHNSGGLGTPPHLRVESGAIQRANKGVLFIDEISAMKPRWQQEILTAMQDKKYSITGQSEMSSGAIVKTEPVPCDFVLVAAGNPIDMRSIHPALRSRIRGNGYEVYVEDSMPDTPENQDRLVQFVAQEVRKDGKIPHFDRDAVLELVDEARRRAGRKKKLSLNLRELGGVLRAAGDIAREGNAKYVTREHVLTSLGLAQTMEQQISKRFIENKKDYKVFLSEGSAVGKVNGLAVLGDGSSGLVLPIVAEVTPASSKNEGKLIATGKLGKIAQEAVENVSAIIKKHTGKDVSQYDFHVQFLQTYEGVEGDSASISIALAVISAMEGIPVRQECAMTGSLSVRGEVLPVGGVTGKVEAAIEAGMKCVLVPKANFEDIYLPEKLRAKIKVIPVSNIVEVLQNALVECAGKKKLIREMRGMTKK